MVGPPKSLHGLSKVDAAVRLRCNDCGHTVDRGLEDLIAEVREEGGSTCWPQFIHSLRCPNCRCSGAMLRPKALPFTKGEPRKRGFQALVINLALAILKEAAWRPDHMPRATQDVRLALHVLGPFIGDSKLLTAFWEKADVPAQHPWESCRPLFAGIAATLRQRGFPVWGRHLP